MQYSNIWIKKSSKAKGTCSNIILVIKASVGIFGSFHTGSEVLSPEMWVRDFRSEFSQTETSVRIGLNSVQFNSVAQSCPTLCDPMNRSTPGLPVYHQLPESTQTHVHWVGDAIQPSHPLPPLLLLPSVFPSIRVFSNLFIWCLSVSVGSMLHESSPGFCIQYSFVLNTFSSINS